MTTTPAVSMSPVDQATQHEVEQFLYTEAELLDDHRYTEWIELFTDDVHYWLPTRMTRSMRERDAEVSGPDGAAFFDDDKNFLAGRVRRLTSGQSWSEEPPSRTRRLLTNIRVTELETGELRVRSNFHVLRSRLERHQDSFFGERTDILRRTAGTPGFRIARRTIVLDTTTLPAPSISVFL
ncbi:aromatic-ring-hydroxylating dioxygenase subunit beta [Streptomyces vastus]|uniref:3-phenylpropionate/cinnamic acid dioxygenase subunit beta n=1 Tax=Streptomyces vastus TaxID=285451 RepID=A0ABN3R8B4_9ACTN